MQTRKFKFKYELHNLIIGLSVTSIPEKQTDNQNNEPNFGGKHFYYLSFTKYILEITHTK